MIVAQSVLGGAVLLAAGRPATGLISILGTGAQAFHVVAPSRFLIRTRL
jgi:hypothetical protein